MTGLIFDIVEYALHDGPGVRTSVFFKGCPLRCQWCHNPESQSPNKELMYSAQSCLHCGKCVCACPAPQRCTACGTCVSACPLRLRKIAGYEVDALKLAADLKKNHRIFAKSGGGVTISGGEPLYQHLFCFELMEALSPVHVALDTSGFADNAIFLEAVRRASLILFDVKLMDPEKHRQYTGVDNELILSNLNLLCRGNTPFIVRVPVIPGVNDDEKFAADLCRFIKDAQSLIRVDLLPYNKGAGLKYAMLNRVFAPEFDYTAAPRMQTGIYQDFGIQCIVQ